MCSRCKANSFCLISRFLLGISQQGQQPVGRARPGLGHPQSYWDLGVWEFPQLRKLGELVPDQWPWHLGLTEIAFVVTLESLGSHNQVRVEQWRCQCTGQEEAPEEYAKQDHPVCLIPALSRSLLSTGWLVRLSIWLLLIELWKLLQNILAYLFFNSYPKFLDKQ